MFLIRSRLRAITSSKQARMAENSNQTSSSSSSEQNQSPPLSNFLNSPRFFGGLLLSRSISDEISFSATPTSILDIKQTPFGHDHKKALKSSSPTMMITRSSENNNNRHSYEKQGIGLALIDDDGKQKEEEDYDKQLNKKMILFAAKLKVEVPPFFTSDFSPKSPVDFGIKTKNLQLLRSSSLNSSCIKGRLLDYQEGVLSVSEMEMSEEYTCVITHGPNPKITHIFDDTVLESCCGTVKSLSADDDSKYEQEEEEEPFLLQNNVDVIISQDFLGFCNGCKNKLEDEKDIYMFRVEKGFCSEECRFQEMVAEGKADE